MNAACEHYRSQLPQATLDLLKALVKPLTSASPPPANGKVDRTYDTGLQENLNLLTQELKNLEPVQRTALCTLLAQWGHLRHIASEVADHRAADPATHYVRNGHFRTAGEALEQLGTTRLDLTFTGHPTNSNSEASMKAQRALVKALKASKGKMGTEVKAALQAYLSAPLLPHGPDGKPAALTVRGEIETMLYTMKNLYDDLPSIYQGFDAAFKKTYPDGYEPEKLFLNLQVHSWGSSGDKDGNKNVTADTTLLAIALHKKFILEAYRKDFAALADQTPAIQDITNQLQDALTEIGQVVTELDKAQAASKSSFFLTSDAFDALSARLREATASLTADALENAAQSVSPPTPQSIDLRRRIHLFGTHGGKIEYRETAEEFSRVMGLLIDGYEKASDKLALLKEWINAPDKKKIENALRNADGETVVHKAYDTKNAYPIAYHTLKRYQLARDFPEMIERQVLAEFQGAHNALESIALQQAVAEGDRHPALSITPLFEESETLKNAPDIMETLLRDRDYQAHLERIAGQRQVPKHQQIQLAHSDNARRAGMPVARGLIAQAHDRLREVFAGHEGIALQFYEGGSQSDIYRGGFLGLAHTADTFGVHDFLKVTMQGGDLFNFLNTPESSARLIAGTLAHNALSSGHRAARKEKADNNRYYQALRRPADHYQQLFNDPEFSTFMDRLGYKDCALAGNFSSRAGSRAQADDGKPVPVDSMRTIGFSETLQHAGLSPTWLGSKALLDSIASSWRELPTARAGKLNELYKSSPVFKDVVDRVLIGALRTRFSQVDSLAGNHYTANLKTEYREATQLALEAKTGKPFNFRSPAFKLESDVRNEVLKHYPAALTQELQDRSVYAELLGQVKQALIRTPDIKRWQMPSPGKEGEMLTTDSIKQKSEQEFGLMQLLHNAVDTVVHTRIPMIDDPLLRQQAERTGGRAAA